MTAPGFRERYQLLQEVAQGPVRSFHAMAATGVVVMVHFLEAGNEKNRALLDLIEGLRPTERKRVLEIAEVDDNPVVVTRVILDFKSLEAWLRSFQRDTPATEKGERLNAGEPPAKLADDTGPVAAPTPAPPPASAPPTVRPSEFTMQFGRPLGVADAPPPPSVPPPPASAPTEPAPATPPPPPPSEPGEFTRLFRTVDVQSEPPAPPPMPPAPPAPSPPVPAPDFNRTLEPAATEKPAKPLFEPPPPPLVSPPPAADASDFTRMFGAPAVGARTPPSEPPPRAPLPPQPPPPEPSAPGGFTQVFGKVQPPAKPPTFSEAPGLGSSPTLPSTPSYGADPFKAAPPPPAGLGAGTDSYLDRLNTPGGMGSSPPPRPGDPFGQPSAPPGPMPGSPFGGGPPIRSGPSEFTRVISGANLPGAPPNVFGGPQGTAPKVPPAQPAPPAAKSKMTIIALVGLAVIIILAVTVIIVVAVKSG